MARLESLYLTLLTSDGVLLVSGAALHAHDGCGAAEQLHHCVPAMSGTDALRCARMLSSFDGAECSWPHFVAEKIHSECLIDSCWPLVCLLGPWQGNIKSASALLESQSSSSQASLQE